MMAVCGGAYDPANGEYFLYRRCRGEARGTRSGRGEFIRAISLPSRRGNSTDRENSVVTLLNLLCSTSSIGIHLFVSPDWTVFPSIFNPRVSEFHGAPAIRATSRINSNPPAGVRVRIINPADIPLNGGAMGAAVGALYSGDFRIGRKPRICGITCYPVIPWRLLKKSPRAFGGGAAENHGEL